MEGDPIPDVLASSGERVLCLAPPGELDPLASRLLAAVGAEGRVAALVRGDPYLHCVLPPRLEILEGDPARPRRVAGPFDRVCAWGRTPFLVGFKPFLAPVRRCLRPGGRLTLDLPGYGFCTVLQACDPRAGDWFLPSVDACRSALAEHGFRDIEAHARTELATFATLADLLDDLAAPFPLAFEGEAGQRLQSALRENLAAAFTGAQDIGLARRRLRVRAIR